jgi:hypothetical protein
MGLASMDSSNLVCAVIVPRKPDHLTTKEDASVLLDTGREGTTYFPPRAAFNKQHGRLCVRVPEGRLTVSTWAS